MNDSRPNDLAARLYGSYAWLVFILVLGIFGTAIAIIGRPKYGRRIARGGARLLFKLSGFRLQADGLERLPSAPHLLLVNHASFLDGLALAALLPAAPGYAFAVRQQYASQALLWPLLRGLGTLRLKRRRQQLPRPPSTELIAARLAAGENLVVFPEGRYVAEPGLLPFHTGAFVAAAMAGVPVVIAGLRGTRQALPCKNWLPRRVDLHLRIGPVLTVPQSPSQIENASRHARAEISRLCGEPPTGQTRTSN